MLSRRNADDAAAEHREHQDDHQHALLQREGDDRVHGDELTVIAGAVGCSDPGGAKS